MDTFVTVLTVQYPQQLWIIKGRLESEGIQCFVKDELTVQAYNLYSNAVGGVKLQVQKQDVERAVEILTDLGYIKEEPIKPDLLTQINEKKASIPFLKKVNVGQAIIIVTLSFVVILTTLLYFIFRPSVSDLLTRNSWCVDRVDYKGQLIGPKTTESFSIKLLDRNGNADCLEKMTFDNTGHIKLPGINSNPLLGHWKIGDDITIDTDYFTNIFNGNYKMELSNNLLVLKSNTTTIYAHRDDFQFSSPINDLNR